jgi:hypothetical protein
MRPYLEKTLHKNWAGGVAQGIGREFKPQYCEEEEEEAAASVARIKTTVRTPVPTGPLLKVHWWELLKLRLPYYSNNSTFKYITKITEWHISQIMYIFSL